MTHPIQPIEKDNHGVLRFKENKIVTYLLDKGPFDLNEIGRQDFTREDREQFNQLIGYSISGFSDLSCASDEVCETVFKMAEGKTEQEARIEYLEETLKETKKLARDLVVKLFNKHPDDLEI